MKKAGPIVRRSVAALAEDPAERDRTDARADAARAVQDADAGRRAAADREDALAEDRQQQQHAAGQSPSGLHAHQRRDVRCAPHVPEALDQIGDAGERR